MVVICAIYCRWGRPPCGGLLVVDGYYLGISTIRRVLSLYQHARYHSLDKILVVNLPYEPYYMVLAISWSIQLSYLITPYLISFETALCETCPVIDEYRKQITQNITITSITLVHRDHNASLHKRGRLYPILFKNWSISISQG